MQVFKRIFHEKFNINTIAILTSLVTVIFLMMQIRLMGKQTQVFINQAKNSSWPRLSVSMSRGFKYGGMNLLRLSIANKGVGPGIIEDVNLSYKGKEFNTWWEFYNLIKVPDSIARSHSDSGIYKGFVISSNENINIIDWSKNEDLMVFVHKQLMDVKMKIKFMSIYGDSWVLEKDFSSDFDMVTKIISN